jgi:hypothetical protein
MNVREEIPRMRPLVVLVVLAASGAASAYVETHVDEITTPVADYATARVAALSAQPTRTPAEKRELAQLKALSKKLDKPQLFLKGDFAELSAAAKTFVALKTAGAPMKASLDESFARASLSLSERVDFAQDHLDLLVDAKHRKSVQTLLASVATTRTKSAAATTPAKRAALLVSADALVTKTLKTAEKFVVKDFGGNVPLPPTRFRSGDTIDLGGGRVAIPRDADLPLAGASILIPGGLFATPVIVTLSVAPSFVGGRDVAAFPSALAVSPDGLPLGDAATVTLPFVPNADQSPQSLAIFSAGPPQTSSSTVETHADQTLSAKVSSFSTFQAGYAAPPPGQPGGSYSVQMFVIGTGLDATNSDNSGVSAGIIQETMTFRADHTAATSLPGLASVTRTFARLAPHHADSSQSPFISGVNFTWTGGPAGRFAFDFPLNTAGDTAHAEAVASDDGRVISFTGRASTFDFFGVGLKGGPTAGVADLAGRWTGVETGVELTNSGQEPFTTRWFDAFRAFTVDGTGVATFENSGQTFATDVTYHTDQADPVHERVASEAADSGAETWTVSTADGFVVGAQNRRFGRLDKQSGVLVLSWYDATARRASMMLAVPQPAASTPSGLPATFHCAFFDVGTSVGVPDARSSTHDTTPFVGALDVQSSTAATLSLDATTRNTYTLSGQPPLASMTWSMSLAPTAVATSSTPLTLLLDASGNHRVATDERWYAFSPDGRYVLELSRGEATRLARGIGLGVK